MVCSEVWDGGDASTRGSWHPVGGIDHTGSKGAGWQNYKHDDDHDKNMISRDRWLTSLCLIMKSRPASSPTSQLHCRGSNSRLFLFSEYLSQQLFGLKTKSIHCDLCANALCRWLAIFYPFTPMVIQATFRHHLLIPFIYDHQVWAAVLSSILAFPLFYW